MTQYPLTPATWYPTHCAVCLAAGKKTPAKWAVNQGQGTYSYLACDRHRNELEIHGADAITKAAARNRTRRAV
jgi:hypothetical protein